MCEADWRLTPQRSSPEAINHADPKKSSEMTRVSTPFSRKEVLPSHQSVNHDIIMENKASHLHLYEQTVKKRKVWLRYHGSEACTRAGSTVGNDSSAELLLTSSTRRGKKDRGVKAMRGEQKSETWTKGEWFMQKIELAWCSAERRPTELMRSAARLSPATTSSFFLTLKQHRCYWNS